MPQGEIQPSNAILTAGQPIIEELEVLTTTEFCPGKLVIYDTTDYQCKAAGAAAANVLGVADCPSDKKLTDYFTASAGGAVTDTFDAADMIRVIRGPVRVKCILVSGQTITKGDRLVAAANGMVTECTADSGAPEDIIGFAAEAPAANTTCQWLLVDLTI